ncbi:MAG: hypothetical protein QXI16_03530 [Sulfolobaceae archaeon]
MEQPNYDVIIVELQNIQSSLSQTNSYLYDLSQVCLAACVIMGSYFIYRFIKNTWR